MLLPAPGDLILVGEKFAIRPDGCPVTVTLIADLNVEEIVVVTETATLFPAKIVAELTDAAKVNVAGIVTTKLTVAVFDFPPDVAVIVSG